jgi:hypothetical protein
VKSLSLKSLITIAIPIIGYVIPLAGQADALIKGTDSNRTNCHKSHQKSCLFAKLFICGSKSIKASENSKFSDSDTSALSSTKILRLEFIQVANLTSGPFLLDDWPYDSYSGLSPPNFLI